jgi:hypothetical protein
MIAFTFIDSKSLGGNRHPAPLTGGVGVDIPVVSGQVTNLNLAMVRKSVGALVKFESGPFRQRHDGGLPISSASISTASGYLRSDGDEYFYIKEEATVFSVVLDTLGPLVATEGMLRVTYYG